MYSWKTVAVSVLILLGLKIWSPYIVDNIKWSYFDYLHSTKEKEQVEDILLVNMMRSLLRSMVNIHFLEMYTQTHYGKHITQILMYSIYYLQKRIDLVKMNTLQMDYKID